ncbi:DsbA family protein [uncultured Tateyamaria sp.]|uniref:DsbA family protein n=1 Tax=uncultured Tateyamaria sp. TaxID=455651 RepID=UPI002636B7AA|nr:DsbA family protein [uncultured Tateyamaria sp.]
MLQFTLPYVDESSGLPVVRTRQEAPMPDEKLIVIYDTFCGWCYGASPVFDALIETDAEVEVLHRYLFQGASAPKMSEGKGAQILQTIPHVQALTGQVFSEAFKSKIALSETEILESGLSAQAAALIHDQGPQKEFALRRRLENLHFGEGMSSSNRQAIVDALIAEGVPADQVERVGTPELAAEAAKISAQAQAWMSAVGSRGVPTVLRVTDDDVTQVDHQSFYGRAKAVPSNPKELETV